MPTTLRKIKSALEIVAIVFGLACTIYGVIIAKGALSEYKKDNRLSAQVKLDDKEARLYDRARANDRLHSFWAYLPDGLTPREKMLFQLNLLVNQDASGGSMSQISQLKFKDVQDLDRVLWNHDTFGNPIFEQLREGYDYAEEMLFMAESAHSAFMAGVLTKEDWRGMDTYIDDVAAHPLFIEAVSWGHDGANYSRAFAEVLKHKYISKKDLRDAALEIYPTIINDPKWADNMGIREAP